MHLPRRWAFTVAFVASSAGLLGCASSGSPESQQDRSLDYVERIPGTSITFDMVWIPDGAFWMGETEVTWDEYLVFCNFNAPLPAGVDAVTRPSKPLEVHPYDRHWGTGRRPAVGMSRNGAERYCAWLSSLTGREYRLPTEQEWERACGSGTPTPLADHAWFARNSAGKTQEVGRKLPNRHGLHDMLGNLWEYCVGGFRPEEPERAVLRGGSWRESAREISPSRRLAFDDDWTLDDPGFPPGVWWVPDGDHLGFRLLRSGPAGRSDTNP